MNAVCTPLILNSSANCSALTASSGYISRSYDGQVVKKIVQPWSAKARQTAVPIPRDRPAPVTTTTRPRRSGNCISLSEHQELQNVLLSGSPGSLPVSQFSVSGLCTKG